MAAVTDAARRSFLRGRAPGPTPMRPPWALAEAEFVDACTRCGDCVRACSERILAPGDGGYPQVRAGAGECTFCGDCERACIARALDRSRVERAWRWQARVDTRCLTQAGIVCQSCRDACPEHAIRFPPARVPAPQVDASRCSACGACVPACPAQAIALSPEPA